MSDVERRLVELGARVAAETSPSAALARRVFRRSRVRRFAAAAAAGAVAVAAVIASVGVVGGAEPPERVPPASTPDATSTPPGDERPPLDFEPAPGWHVRTTDPSVTDEREAQAWASNVPFAADEEPIGGAAFFPDGWPDKTEAELPPDGILVVASFPLHTRNPLPPIRDVPRRSLPLPIEDEPHTAVEGGHPDRAQTGVNAIVHGRYLSVRIVFGTADPSEDLIRQAERELGRLRVAPPPATTDALDDFGIRMEVPEAWHAILFRWAGAEPILHAATVPVTDLYSGSSARRALGNDDLFLVLAESYAAAAQYEEVSLPVAIRPVDECPTCEILDDGTSPPDDHTLYYRSFAVDGRRFDLYAELGTASPTDEDVARVNDVLETLAIGPPDAPPSRDAPEEVEERGVAAVVPAGWVEKTSAVAASTGPRVVAAYGTWDFPRGGACGPEPALAALPWDGALVWVTEHADPGNAGDYYTLSPSVDFEIDLQTPPARWECAGAAPSRMYLFRVDGRYLEVHVALGPHADEATVREAGDLIASLARPR